MSSVELVSVGSSHCLFRPETHALALLNDGAADAWRRLEAGAEPCETDGALIEQWRNAGFGRGDLPHGNRASRLTRHAAVQGERICISSGTAMVAVAVEDATLRELLAAVLRPLTIPGRPSNLIEVRGPGPYEIVSRGVLLSHVEAPSDARRIALQAILLELFPVGAVSALIHASSLSIDGRALLVAGATGAGKSTLTAALVAHGAGYLGDDFAALDNSGTAVGAFPIAASIKSGSWPIVATDFPQLMDSPEFTLGTRRVRYLDFGKARPSRHDIQSISALIFPHYKRDEESRMTPMTPEHAFAELIASGSEIVGNPRSVKPLVRLVERCPAWQMDYGRLDDAVDAALAIARRPCP
ncbi:MAG: hypothetical protein RLZ98_79 [Pseudomonadota bacterium]|jgi:hypothetical protein